MPELFIEILSEEIPARMQADATRALQNGMTKGFRDAGLEFGDVETFVTPRRLGIVIADLPKMQTDTREERRGPRVGAPEKAMQGFLGSTGLKMADLEEREVKDTTFYFAVIEKKGRPTPEIIAEVLSDVIVNFPWPKAMRWGSGRLRWVRPMENLCVLFDGKVVPLDILGEMTATGLTYGHRFMAPDAIDIQNFENFKKKILKAKVIIAPEEREALIRKEAEALAGSAGFEIVPDDALFREVAGLVEWPVVLLGHFDDAFLIVPPEVLTTAMRSHQKYFALNDSSGNLAPAFILVANYEAPDKGKMITEGNERVLSARLADAQFFWEQDQKVSLAEHAKGLEGVIFHAELGNLQQKVARIGSLAASILKALQEHPLQASGFAESDVSKAVRRAAELCKADLVTGMVAEFPDLQGLMGRYYAEKAGEPQEVAAAIEQHYAPKGPSDACPTELVSMVTALSDKIDTLAGFFMIDQPPTGSRDPYALRRAALGVIRILLESGLRLNLHPIITEALEGYTGQGFSTKAKDSSEGVVDFIATRLSVHLRESGVPHDYINAVFALEGEDDLVCIVARVAALADFLKSSDGENLLSAYKRATNIVAIEEERDDRTYDGPPKRDVLELPEETALFDSLEAASKASRSSIETEAFGDVMAALATLRAPVDAFFDKVTVNAEDKGLRENRLKLLAQIRETLGFVADFSEIEGP